MTSMILAALLGIPGVANAATEASVESDPLEVVVEGEVGRRHAMPAVKRVRNGPKIYSFRNGSVCIEPTWRSTTVSQQSMIEFANKLGVLGKMVKAEQRIALGKMLEKASRSADIENQRNGEFFRSCWASATNMPTWEPSTERSETLSEADALALVDSYFQVALD
ncbi:MAG: hypothetical protein KC621_04450 [Myxococcales bacterium]|nr:hypothetical protein [Myxococcales bacterium]